MLFSCPNCNLRIFPFSSVPTTVSKILVCAAVVNSDTGFCQTYDRIPAWKMSDLVHRSNARHIGCGSVLKYEFRYEVDVFGNDWKRPTLTLVSTRDW